jgi:hypothetical protein
MVLLVSVLGLEIDLAVNGDTEKERREMTVAAGMDIVMSLPAIFGAVSEGAGFLRTSLLTTEVSYEMQELPASKLFKPLERVNGKLGYPLNPTKPPKLPGLQEDVHEPISSEPSSKLGLPGTSTAGPAVVWGSKLTLDEGSNKRTFQQSTEDLPGPNVARPETPDFATGNKAGHYYDELYKTTTAEMKALLEKDPLSALIENDLKANDLTNRFKDKEKNIITMFIKDKQMSYFSGRVKEKQDNWNWHYKEYKALEFTLKEAYEGSPTFRRLFNYACDKSLNTPENRWLIAPNEHFRTTEDLKETFDGKRTIGMNIKAASRLLYQSGEDLAFYTRRHAILNEMITALLIDYHSENSLGTLHELVVNYANCSQ